MNKEEDKIYKEICALNIPINPNIKLYPIESQKEILDYLKELDDIHKVAYMIAFEHLESSFNIEKSNGFNEWRKKTASSLR